MTTTFAQNALETESQAIAFLESHGLNFNHEKLAYEIAAQIEDRYYWHNRQAMPKQNKKVLVEQLLNMYSDELLLIGQKLQAIVQLEQSSSLRYREIKAALENKAGSGNTAPRTRNKVRVRTAR